ncbi:MAG TPA: FtsX-like permease family protein [Pyrinomonadaceae bacterium]|nr:FtsX-like permease family protein [Pyrinomonadaceae bacterium]
MPYELFLALRYLRARRGGRVVKVTALAAVFGVAFGVAALVVALALANGFRDELRDKILKGTAHLTVARTGGASVARAGGASLDDWRAVAARVRAVAGVATAEPTSYEGALLSGPEGASYAVLRGVSADSPRALAEVKRTLLRGSADELASAFVDKEIARTESAGSPSAQGDADEETPLPVVVGEELAARTGLGRVGSEGWIVSGEASTLPQLFTPRTRRVRVAGLFRSGLHDYDAAWAYVPLEEGATGNTQAHATVARPSVISVEAHDIYATGEVAASLRGALGEGWTVVDWREANRPLFAALELERRTVAFIIMLIVVVAALNITTALALLVVERRAEIAVLRVLGASARSVTAIFVAEGALVGAAGALLGVALGLLVCALGNRYELVRLPADVYSLSAVPFHPHARDVLLPALAAFAISLVATLHPARTAARTRPAEVLRHE